MNKQSLQNALFFVEIGARSLADREPNLEKAGNILLTGVTTLAALREVVPVEDVVEESPTTPVPEVIEVVGESTEESPRKPPAPPTVPVKNDSE